MDTTDEQKSSGETEADHEQEAKREQPPRFVFNPFLTDMQSSGRQEETRNG
jgi:hypothetical protein